MSSEVEIVDPGPIVARELFEEPGVSIYSHAHCSISNAGNARRHV